MKTKNKIVGTNFLKNKYKLATLTQEDIQYLIDENIALYRCYHLKDDAFIYTNFKAVSNCLKNTYSKKQLWDLLPTHIVENWFDGGNPFITTTDMISALVTNFTVVDLHKQLTYLDTDFK